MKSQVITVENVLFFSLGIILVFMVYFTFNSISEQIKEISMKEELKKVATYISYNINKVYRIGNTTNSSIELYVSIPDQILGEIYRISQDNGNIFLRFINYDFRYNLTLYGKEAKLKYKEIPSSKKWIIIGYSNGKVKIKVER